MTMDYSPWSEGEIWPFLKVAISPKLERSRPSKLVCMHLTSIPTCMNLLSHFRSIKLFDDHGLWSMFRRGNLAVFKVAISPKLDKLHPPKLVCMHLTSIPTCMNFWADSNRLNFLMTMDYLTVFESSNISKTG